MGSYMLKFEDYDGDSQQITFPTADAPLGAAVDTSAWNNAAIAFRDSLLAVTVGRLRAESLAANEDDNGKGTATSPVAQKSTQLICVYQHAVTNIEYTQRVPMPDLAAQDGGDNIYIRQDGLTVLDLASVQGLAFKAQWDGFVLHRNDDDTLSVTALLKAYVEE